MPGICGVVMKEGPHQRSPEPILTRMVDILTHQDTYVVRKHVEAHAGLASISVRDPRGILHLDHAGDRYAVLHDGFLYNVQGKPRTNASDRLIAAAETTLLALARKDIEALTALEGNFCLGLCRVSDGQMTLITDIVAPRMLYYADLPDMFVFAPEIKGISFLPGFKKEIDWKAVSDFLQFGYPLGEDTFFSAVKTAPSAALIAFDPAQGGVTRTRYWKPRYTERSVPLEECADACYGYLHDSIDEKVRANQRVISPVSGGLDSRMILGVLEAIRQKGKPIEIKPVTYGQEASHEYGNAKKVCKALDVKGHALIEITPDALVDKFLSAVWLSDGMAAMVTAHLLLLPAFLGADYDAFLNGIYGGPTNYSSGYYTSQHLQKEFGFDEKVQDIIRVLGLGTEPYEKMLSAELFQHLQTHRFSSISDELHKTLDVSHRFCHQRDAFFIENRMRRGICQGALFRFFWEEHLPLVNAALYRFYLSVPAEYKLDRTLLKTMIKEKFPALGGISDANTGLTLFQTPTSWYRRRRQLEAYYRYYVSRLSFGLIEHENRSSYAHHEKWLRKNERTSNFYKGCLFGESFRESGFTQAEGIRQGMRRFLKGGPGFYHLMRLTTVAIWYALFVAEEGTKEVRERVRALRP